MPFGHPFGGFPDNFQFREGFNNFPLRLSASIAPNSAHAVVIDDQEVPLAHICSASPLDACFPHIADITPRRRMCDIRLRGERP